MEQPVAIPVNNDVVIADVHLGSSTAVVVLPGWGGTRYGPQRILLKTASAFAAAGYSSLRLDFRGRGDSSGVPQETTLDGMIQDAITTISWLRSTHHIERVHLVGLCSGGNVALGTASLLPEIVDTVVCWSLLPFMEHKSLVAHQGTNRSGLLKQLMRKAFRPESWRKLLHGEANIQGVVKVIVNDKEGDELEKQRKTSQRDILTDFTKFSGKLFLLYGSRDPEASGSQEFFTSWCRKHHIPVTSHVIQGAPHNFYTAQWTDTVVQQTLNWIINTQG